MLKWFIVFLLAAIAALLWRRATASSRRLPAPGEPAPAFDLPDQDGRTRALEEYRGKWLVLYFYPRDDTTGCTEQAVQFRDALREFDCLNAMVVGISVDDMKKHVAFRSKYKLPFSLLADVKGVTAARYGSLLDLLVLRFAKRNTFLIDPQGRIAKTYLKVNPSRNATDVIADLKSLVAP
ncbi:MAG: peroxiredoxin [Bradyrhizobium sp.]